MPNPYFTRTSCACAQCQSCCHEQPGFLGVGDFERIRAYLGCTVDELRAKLWASPGALVMNIGTGRQFRIGTITPRLDRRKKRCVFQADNGMCTIHEVAPFGCSFFDTHMPLDVAKPRSAWMMRQIQESPDYKKLRDSLPFADSWKPRGYEE